VEIIRSRRSQMIQRQPKFWSVHTHSRYSNNDALPKVEAIVDRVAELGQKALAITDHGNMAASVELYTECSKRGITPFPGSELYFVPDLNQYKADYKNRDKKAERYHLGVVAYTTEGYENLVNLSTLTHQNHFYKPTLDFSMLAQLAEDGRTAGLAVTTGCFFGYAVQQLITKGPQATMQYLACLNTWFPDSVYVELQNHNITHNEEWNDDVVADAMVELADRMGLACVTTQDSHYVRESDREDHEALKRLVAFGPDPDDAVFPGDGFHLADDRWMRSHHGPDRFARGVEGLADLLARHRLRIPVLDSYSYSVPRVVNDPQQAMVKRCYEALTARGLSHRPYTDKLAEEFDVIKAADMAGYMMLVAKITDYMHENEVVFQTRGSAAGSLVCWLLGISNVDPIKWDLRFERFLSRDRTKPPDIDLDIAHDRREEMVQWLESQFVTHQIGSWAEYSVNQDENTKEWKETGSLLKRYFTTARKYDDNPPKEFSEIPSEDLQTLYRLSDRQLYSGMGTNAAGVVITTNRYEFDKLVPLAYMSSRKAYVTQYKKDQIELLGLVKLDVLGSKTLTVVQRAMQNLGLPLEKLEEIEYNDAPTYKLMSSGKTEGVFQLEGNTSKRGCRQLRPNNIKDVIAAMALFRSSVMKSGGTDAYIKRKHKKQAVPVRHPVLSEITKSTYGVLVYQEQVIDMLRYLGMDPEDLTAFLKAVKSSNKEIAKANQVIAGYMEWISERCQEQGFSEADMAFLDEAIRGFGEYGFNRAHATVYGITSYRCAYLAARHPLEFHAALLAVAAGEDKELEYISATRKRGVSVLPPAVNASRDTYAVDTKRGAIRKGLRSVNGVGEKSAEILAQLAPFKDLDDLVQRSPARPISGGKDYDGTIESLTGVLGKLRDGGALRGL
jgi:DNA polymerase-3 subunit alpha